MSTLTKRDAKYAKEFFQEVQQTADECTKCIPDKRLHEKIRKVSETSKEVVKYLEEHLGDKKP